MSRTIHLHNNNQPTIIKNTEIKAPAPTTTLPQYDITEATANNQSLADSLTWYMPRIDEPQSPPPTTRNQLLTLLRKMQAEDALTATKSNATNYSAQLDELGDFFQVLDKNGAEQKTAMKEKFHKAMRSLILRQFASTFFTTIGGIKEARANAKRIKLDIKGDISNKPARLKKLEKKNEAFLADHPEFNAKNKKAYFQAHEKLTTSKHELTKLKQSKASKAEIVRAENDVAACEIKETLAKAKLGVSNKTTHQEIRGLHKQDLKNQAQTNLTKSQTRLTESESRLNTEIKAKAGPNTSEVKNFKARAKETENQVIQKKAEVEKLKAEAKKAKSELKLDPHNSNKCDTDENISKKLKTAKQQLKISQNSHSNAINDLNNHDPIAKVKADHIRDKAELKQAKKDYAKEQGNAKKITEARKPLKDEVQKAQLKVDSLDKSLISEESKNAKMALETATQAHNDHVASNGPDLDTLKQKQVTHNKAKQQVKTNPTELDAIVKDPIRMKEQNDANRKLIDSQTAAEKAKKELSPGQIRLTDAQEKLNITKQDKFIQAENDVHAAKNAVTKDKKSLTNAEAKKNSALEVADNAAKLRKLDAIAAQQKSGIIYKAFGEFGQNIAEAANQHNEMQYSNRKTDLDNSRTKSESIHEQAQRLYGEQGSNYQELKRSLAATLRDLLSQLQNAQVIN